MPSDKKTVKYESHKNIRGMMPKRLVKAMGAFRPDSVIPSPYHDRGKVTILAGHSDFNDPAVSLINKIKGHVEWEAQHGEVRRPDSLDGVGEATKSSGKVNSITRRAFKLAAMRFLKSVIGAERYIARWTPKGGGFFFMMADRVLYVNTGPGGHWKCTRVPEEGLCRD